MEKKYFYFQPQYVNRFKCDGSKCDAHCCQEAWEIFIDEGTYKQYAQLGSEIVSHMEFHSDKGEYFIRFGERKYCPFLNENKLCSLQLKYGEKFLSKTCATYPRITNHFGKFFERSLLLSCPVAAEMILFEREPLKFEFAEVSEKVHSHGGKIFYQVIQAADEIKAHLADIQAAMISILQERTLTIDQRLIVLSFFVDRLGEIFSDFDEDALTKLIAAYKSKKFWAEQVPLMIRSVEFDAEKFIGFMRDLTEKILGAENAYKHKQILKNIAAALPRVPDKKVYVDEHSGFFENFLVNELFLSVFPWQSDGSLAQNFAAFAAEYKLFELITFSVARRGFGSKKDLVRSAGWFTTRFDHTKEYRQKVFSFVADVEDPFLLMDSLFDGRD